MEIEDKTKLNSIELQAVEEDLCYRGDIELIGNPQNRQKKIAIKSTFKHSCE